MIYQKTDADRFKYLQIVCSVSLILKIAMVRKMEMKNIYKTMNICKISQTIHSGKKIFILVTLTMNQRTCLKINKKLKRYHQLV